MYATESYANKVHANVHRNILLIISTAQLDPFQCNKDSQLHAINGGRAIHCVMVSRNW